MQRLVQLALDLFDPTSVSVVEVCWRTRIQHLESLMPKALAFRDKYCGAARTS